jgi:hypothetical protein
MPHRTASGFRATCRRPVHHACDVARSADPVNSFLTIGATFVP